MTAYFLLASTPGVDLRPVADGLGRLGVTIALATEIPTSEPATDPIKSLFEFQGELLAAACDRVAALQSAETADEEPVVSTVRDRLPEWGWNKRESFDGDRFQDSDNRGRLRLKGAREASVGLERPWGWGDARSTLLLDFWRSRLPEGRYVLIYDTPWEAIAALCKGDGAPLENLPMEAVQVWAYYAAHLVDFYQRHRDRVVLIHGASLRDRPGAALDLLAQRLGLEPPTDLGIENVALTPAIAPLPDTHPLATWVSQDAPYALQWLLDLDAIADLPAPRDRADRWQTWRQTPPYTPLTVQEAIALPAAPVVPAIQNSPDALPKLSVVIPCYNHGDYLLEAIASVHSCPEPVYEIIIVNDASTEPKTQAILQYLKTHGYRVIDCPTNGGLANARNVGIRAARADYILPLDADNRLRPHYIPQAIAVFEAHPEVGVVYGNAEYIGDRVGPWIVADFDINLLAVGNYIDACAPLRKQVWADCGGYDPHIPDRLGYEDWDLWLSAAERGWRFHHLEDISFEYRVRADSMVAACNQPSNRRRLMYYLVSKHLALYTANFPAIFAYKDVELLEARQQTAELASQISTFQQERDRAIAAAQHHLNLLAEATLKLQPLQRQLPAYQREVKALQTAVQDLQRERNLLQRERDDLQRERDGLQQARQTLEGEIEALRGAIAQWQRAYRALYDLASSSFEAMRTSKFWRLRDRWFTLKKPLLKLTGKTATPEMVDLVPVQLNKMAALLEAGDGSEHSGNPGAIAALGSPNDHYDLWRRHHDPTEADLRRMAREITTWDKPPLISIVMPVYNPPLEFLEAAIASVRQQIYPHWQLCIVDDASTDPQVRPLLEAAAASDGRICLKLRPENGHIVAASNDALALATGDWIALLDHDDRLAPHALYEVVHRLQQQPDAALIYSDEDKIDEADRRSDPAFKPDWCPDSFLSRMYTCHLSVYRRSLLTAIAGFRPGFEGAQDYDLALRAIEQIRPEQIVHIPKILYHWRSHRQSTAFRLDSKNYAADAARRALTEALERRGEPAAKLELTDHGHWIVRYQLLRPGRVTVIIPTRDLADVLDTCLKSLFEKTTYADYEVLIIDNGSVEPATQTLFDRWRDRERDRFRVVAYDAPFNYSKINNFGVEQTDSPYLLFLNNDTEIIDGDWMTALVEQAQRPSIGAVGATLLYPDRTIQHAGVVLGLGGVAGHSHKNYPYGDPGYGAQLKTINNYSAVTAACLMCRRDVFLEVGGFEPSLQVAFNDVDFCLKLLEWGYRNVHLPHVVLYHYESKSRGLENTPEKVRRFQGEIEYMRRRWHQILDADPCYSPNLTRDREDYSINLEQLY